MEKLTWIFAFKVEMSSEEVIFRTHRRHRFLDYVYFNLIGACDVDARWGRFWGPSRAALSLEMPRSPGFREEARESRQASSELLSL